MNFQFFENLSQSDADLFLTTFLSHESRVAGETIAWAASEGVSLRFDIASIKPMFMLMLGKVKSIPKEPDPTLPSWITATDTYQKGLFTLDEPSNILTLTGAYFLGESFVKEYPQLCWGTGDRETALQNMPVVKGFDKGLELPPILVTQNLLRRIHGKDAPTQIIDAAIGKCVSSI